MHVYFCVRTIFLCGVTNTLLNAISSILAHLQMQQLSPQTWKLIDAQLLHSRQQNQLQQWQSLTRHINQAYSVTLKPQHLITRYQRISTKLPDDDIRALLNHFKKHGFSFTNAAEQISCSLNQAKREITQVLVNNIMKMCFIVRKRNISSLKNNFITDQKIQKLVRVMLKEDIIKEVSSEFTQLWDFISNLHPKGHFASVSNQCYNAIYRELIILSEKFQLHEPFQSEKGAQSGQQYTRKGQIRCSGQNLSPHNANLLQSFKKKGSKQTIDLISSDEDVDKIEQKIEEQEQQNASMLCLKAKQGQENQFQREFQAEDTEEKVSNHSISAPQPMEEEPPRISTSRIREELQITRKRVASLSQQLKNIPTPLNIKEQLSQQVLKLEMLKAMIGQK